MKYAMVSLVSIAVVCGAYFLGYNSGVSKAKVETVEKKIEVIKYVEKQKNKIYSVPNDNRNTLLSLMAKGKL